MKDAKLKVPNPERLADQLSRAVSDSGSSERLLIPLTVLGLAVTLLGTPDELHQPMWTHFAEAPEGWDSMEQMIKMTISCHDWLADHLHPLTSWMHRASERERAATQACWKVVAGIDVYLTLKQPMVDGDLLGVMYQCMSSKSAKQAKGAFYTPMSLSRMIAMMSDIQEGTSVNDPCCGSGGMMVAAAQVMREKGLRPETVHWVANDLDKVAVALAGLNFAAHGMGPNITLTSRNALAPDSPPGFISRAS